MTSSALTAAKAAASATAADLEAITHKLDLAVAASDETGAELSAILSKDAAGEAVAEAHEVAVLKAELDLRASRVTALKATFAAASSANHNASLRLRAEALRASSAILSTSAMERLAAEARSEVEVILKKLACRLEEGAKSNVAALEEARQLDAGGAARPYGLSITGDAGNQVLSIDGQQFVTYVSVARQLEAVGEAAATAVAFELDAPRRAARIAKEKTDADRDARWKADLRDMQERNTARIDTSAL